MYQVTMGKLYDICTKANCSQLEKLHEISEHLDALGNDEKHIVEILGQPEKSRKKRSEALLPIIGKLTKLLFGTADEEELNEIKLAIEKTTNNTQKLAELLINQTKIVEIDIETDKEHFKAAEVQINKFIKEYNKAKHESLFNSAISKVDRKIDQHEKTIEKLITAIIFAKEGQIHPTLLPLETIKQSIQTILKETNNLDFPIKDNELSLSAITRISNVKIYYVKGKLIYLTEIPLLNIEKYSLYKHILLPALQKENNVAYILPTNEYTAISSDFRYFRMTENEKNSCKQSLRALICKDNFPIFNINNNSDCEVKLITKPSFKEFSTCNVIIKKLKMSYFKKLDGKNIWLFTMIKPENFIINCLPYYHKSIELSGTGALTLSAECTARSEEIWLKASKLLITKTNFTFIKGQELNIERILNSYSETDIKLELEQALNDKISEKDVNNDELINSGTKLKDIIYKANEIKKYNGIKEKINIIEKSAIYTGSGVLGVFLIGFITWKIGVWTAIAFLWSTCTSCCTKQRLRRQQNERNEPPRYEIRYVTENSRSRNNQFRIATPLLEQIISSTTTGEQQRQRLQAPYTEM